MLKAEREKAAEVAQAKWQGLLQDPEVPLDADEVQLWFEVAGETIKACPRGLSPKMVDRLNAINEDAVLASIGMVRVAVEFSRRHLASDEDRAKAVRHRQKVDHFVMGVCAYQGPTRGAQFVRALLRLEKDTVRFDDELAAWFTQADLDRMLVIQKLDDWAFSYPE